MEMTGVSHDIVLCIHRLADIDTRRRIQQALCWKPLRYPVHAPDFPGIAQPHQDTQYRSTITLFITKTKWIVHYGYTELRSIRWIRQGPLRYVWDDNITNPYHMWTYACELNTPGRCTVSYSNLLIFNGGLVELIQHWKTSNNHWLYFHPTPCFERRLIVRGRHEKRTDLGTYFEFLSGMSP